LAPPIQYPLSILERGTKRVSLFIMLNFNEQMKEFISSEVNSTWEYIKDRSELVDSFDFTHCKTNEDYYCAVEDDITVDQFASTAWEVWYVSWLHAAHKLYNRIIDSHLRTVYVCTILDEQSVLIFSKMFGTKVEADIYWEDFDHYRISTYMCTQEQAQKDIDYSKSRL
jgi:hypothetical protein